MVDLSMMFPDVARGWIFRAGFAARDLLAQQPFDLVVTSGPPHSAHLAGVLATLGRSEPLWVDMRDPWVGRDGKFAAYGFSFVGLQRALQTIEAFILKRASRLLVNTPEFAEDMRGEHPDMSVSAISNGVDLERVRRPVATSPRDCSLVHVGTFYAGRSLSGVLTAIAEFARERPEVLTRLKLRLAGTMSAVNQAQLESEIAAHGLSGLVEFLGVIPPNEALDLLSRSGIALVLAQDQPLQVPAKLYECLGMGVPALVIAEKNSASARTARQVGAMAVEPSDTAGLRAILDDLLQGKILAPVGAAASISYATRAGELDDLVRAALGAATVPQTLTSLEM